MLENYNIRTDLALETKERFESDQVEISGVVVEEWYDEEKEIPDDPCRDRDGEWGEDDGKAGRNVSDCGGAEHGGAG